MDSDAPEITNINYSYKKPETEVWVLNIDDIPVEKGLRQDQQIVHLAPQSVGGNHKHPRIEWYIGMGSLTLVWLDKEGNKHEAEMNPGGQLKLIKIPPYLPHAVVNTSKDSVAVLYELSDAKMDTKEYVKVV